MRPCRHSCSSGLTLIELLIAMAITIMIALAIFYFYTSLNQGLRRAEREIATLSAFRSFSSALEKNLKCTVVKAGYIPGETPVFKPLHRGAFCMLWPGNENHLSGYDGGAFNDGKCRYLGFFTTSDGIHVDRVEYYFNPAEAKSQQANNNDDDYDDEPDNEKNPHHLMRDDRGRIMFRRVRDQDLPVSAYSGAESDDVPAFRAPKLTGKADSEPDNGEILAEGFSDLYFEFIYAREEPGTSTNTPGSKFKTAPRWPHTLNPEDTSTDETGEKWPRDATDGRTPRGLSFLTLPVAVRVTAEVEVGAETRRYTQTILLPQSLWNEFTRRGKP